MKFSAAGLRGVSWNRENTKSLVKERLILGTKEIFSQLPCVSSQFQNPGAELHKTWESSTQGQMETSRDDQMNGMFLVPTAGLIPVSSDLGGLCSCLSTLEKCWNCSPEVVEDTKRQEQNSPWVKDSSPLPARELHSWRKLHSACSSDTPARFNTWDKSYANHDIHYLFWGGFVECSYMWIYKKCFSLCCKN